MCHDKGKFLLVAPSLLGVTASPARHTQGLPLRTGLCDSHLGPLFSQPGGSYLQPRPAQPPDMWVCVLRGMILLFSTACKNPDSILLSCKQIYFSRGVACWCTLS